MRLLPRSVACVVDANHLTHLRRGRATNVDERYNLSVLESLRRSYRTVTLLAAGALESLEALQRLGPDVVVNLAFSGEALEASFVGSLDMLGIPYTGSGARGLLLGDDKIRSRVLLGAAGIRVPRSVPLWPGERASIDLSPPLIVKPALRAGACQGVHADSLVTTRAEALDRARRIWRRFGVPAVCDEFIVGRELRAGMVETARGFRSVGITEWHFGRAAPGWGFKTEEIVGNLRSRKAQRVHRALVTLPRRVSDVIVETARRALAILDVRGYATLDVRMDALERITVLEVNPNPGLWSGSSIWSRPSFDVNVRRIVEAALLPRAAGWTHNASSLPRP